MFYFYILSRFSWYKEYALQGCATLELSACHAGGRGFESRPLRHYLQ